MRSLATLLVALLTLLLVNTMLPAAAHAQCGGICLYEVGVFDNGASAAGAGARAQDSGTVFFNPAGMTRLEGTHVHVGMVNSIGSLKFDVGSGTEPNPPGSIPPFAGFQDGGNIGEYVPLAGAFVSHAITDRLSVGLAFSGIWGGSANYDNDWAGRTFVTNATLAALSIQPAIAFRVTDWLSVGGGVGAVYTVFSLEFVSSLDRDIAQTVEINDADGWGVYGSVSLLFEPTESTRIGVYYRTEASLTLKGDIDNPTPFNLDYQGEMNFPQGVNVSVYHQLTEKLALLGDVGWSDWSQFGYMPATLAGFTLPIDRGWNDTWRLGAGVRYQALEKLLVMGGFSYDSSPVKNSRRLPDIPAGEGYRFSAGATYKAADNINLGMTYTFLWLGDMGVDNVALPPTGTVTLDGAYDPAHIHFVGIQLQFAF